MLLICNLIMALLHMSYIMPKTTAVKVLNYHLVRAHEFVGDDKQFPSLSQLASRAVSDLCDKLEKNNAVVDDKL